MKQLQQMMQDPQVKELMQKAAAAAAAAGPAPAASSGIAREGVPQRDIARLATVNRSLLTPAQLRAHVAAVHAAVLQRYTAAQRAAVQDTAAKLRARPPGTLAAAASLVWMTGHPELGVLLMGEAAVATPGQPGVLNNYAAFLTMLGAEPQAIPILTRLAADFPANSTVQNNLGQAWYGLGALPEAEKHFTAAIHIFANHTQANQSEADIQEARGDKAGAIASLQHALLAGYSPRAVSRLGKLGVTVGVQGTGWHLPMPQDPLGLEQFKLPAFCAGLEDGQACQARWQGFKDELDRKAAPLNAARRRLAKAVRRARPAAASGDGRRKRHAGAEDGGGPGNRGQDRHEPPAAAAGDGTAAFSRGARRAGGRGRAGEARAAACCQPAARAVRQLRRAGGRGGKTLRQWRRRGAGGQERYCPDIDKVRDARSRALNPLLEQLVQIARPRIQRVYNDYIYYAQYTFDDLQFQLLKTETQLRFITYLGTVNADPEISRCGKPRAPASTKLQDFYDLHCDHIIGFDVPLIGGWDIRCNKMTSHIDITVPFPGFDVGAKGKLVENLDTGSTSRAVSISVEPSAARPSSGRSAPA